MQETTFTLAEAAQLLRCHKETLRRAILEGDLQAARLGRGYRISRMELERFWAAKGGGVLFSQQATVAAAQDKNTEQESKEAEKSRKGGPRGPHQLTLPSL